MRLVTGICLALCLTGTVVAQTQAIDFEPASGYVPGNIVGQQGWTVQMGDPGSAFVIDNTVHSPMNGGTQSLKLGGQPNMSLVWAPLATNVASGVWRVGYDFQYTGQTPDNTNCLFMYVTLYDGLTVPGTTNQIFQTYAQDCYMGNPAGSILWQLGSTCRTPMGGYGYAQLIDHEIFLPNNWNRFEFVMDFNQGLIMDLTAYDISSGSKVPIANNPGTFYFNNNGSAMFNQMTAIGLGFNGAVADEAWWADNITISPATLPPPQIGDLPLSASANVEFTRTLSLVAPQPVTWTLNSGPPGAAIDPAIGRISGWTPVAPGTANFSVSCQNMYGGSDTKAWTVTIKAAQYPDSGPDTPWGTIHGNNSGTQSSDDPRMILSKDWSYATPEVDWMLTLRGANPLATRANFRGSIVFDNAGNLYWKGIGNPCYLCSASPTGTLRWVSNASGTPVGLGGEDTTTPVVGDTQRVYVLTDDGIAAFNKADGDVVWTTALPGANFGGDGNRLTPVLYNGKLYVVSSGQPDKTIYQVDSLTGEIDWSSGFQVNLFFAWWGGELNGQMCFVPSAFGEGIHGLYFNASADTSDQASTYGLAIDPAEGATLQWSDRGGMSARSHVIYLASSGRVCTHTWDNNGATFYCWNLDGSQPAQLMNRARSGHGNQDFGAVDFNGQDVIAGAFEGYIVRYIGIADPNVFLGPLSTIYSTDFSDFALGDAADQNSWQLDDYGSISTSPQIVSDPTGSGRGNVLMLQPPGTDTGSWQGLFLPFTRNKQVLVMEWDQWRADTNDYVGVADEFQWWNDWYANQSDGNIWALASDRDSIPLKPGQWQHIRYEFHMLAGEVFLDVDGTTIYRPFYDPYLNGFDIQMSPTEAGDGGPLYLDNLVISETDPDPAEAPPFGGDGWYQTNNLFHEPGGIGGLYKNEDGKSIYVNGTGASADATSLNIIGFNATDSVMYTDSAPWDADPSLNEPLWFQYDTGTLNYAYGGPVLGPAVEGVPQHLYFFVDDDSLVALTPIRPIPGDFDGDRYVTVEDLATFLQCVNADNGPTIPAAASGCETRDLDGDGDVDQDDFGVFQRCFTGPDTKGSADCAR